MNLPYFAADTLGVTLHLAKGRLTADEESSLPLGPWQIEVSTEVESDILCPTELSFWVKLNRTLRLYLIVRDKENWLFVLNTEALKACGQTTGFASETIGKRLEEIKPAIRGVFHWQADKWTHVIYDQDPPAGEMNASHDLVKESPGKSQEVALTRSTTH